jgi:hypothetical protein
MLQICKNLIICKGSNFQKKVHEEFVRNSKNRPGKEKMGKETEILRKNRIFSLKF